MHSQITYLVVLVPFLGARIQGFPINFTSSEVPSATPSPLDATHISSGGLASLPTALATAINEPTAILVIPTQVEKKKEDNDSEETPDSRPTVAPDGRRIIYLETWQKVLIAIAISVGLFIIACALSWRGAFCTL